MPNEPRFVFDTNVVISALLLKPSVSRQAFDKATQVGKLLVSRATVEELNEVLRRKGFERYVTEEESMFLSTLGRKSTCFFGSCGGFEGRKLEPGDVLKFGKPFQALASLKGRKMKVGARPEYGRE